MTNQKGDYYEKTVVAVDVVFMYYAGLCLAGYADY